jgi:hypothetical protein
MRLCTLRVIFAVHCLLAASCCPGQPNSAAERKGATMTVDQVVESVNRLAWPQLTRPGAVPPAAGPALLALLNKPDPQVRELAVFCLDAAGGPSASKGLLAALRDPVETVNAAASRALANHYTSDEIPAIRKEMSEHPNEVVRENLALLLGKTGSQDNIQFLLVRRSVEKDAQARHAATLALARLGEAGGRQEIAQSLVTDDPKTRVDTLRDLPYVNDRGMLAYALPLLDDERPGLNVGPSHGPYYIRVCDVAVNVIDEMLNHPFNFPIGLRRYTPTEIAQAKSVFGQVR